MIVDIRVCPTCATAHGGNVEQCTDCERSLKGVILQKVDIDLRKATGGQLTSEATVDIKVLECERCMGYEAILDFIVKNPLMVKYLRKRLR